MPSGKPVSPVENGVHYCGLLVTVAFGNGDREMDDSARLGGVRGL